MPYILSPMITVDSPGMWLEGSAYEKRNIYSIEEGELPSVNYDEHILRPHSLTHLETPAHTQKTGKTLEEYYKNSTQHFFGKTLVIKLQGNKYESKGNGIFHWIVTVKEIESCLKRLEVSTSISKLLITTEFYPINKSGYHDPNYVLTLSQKAADFLISCEDFNLYGTSWKSSDFNPGKVERPIHDTLFKKALILENLHLKDVPEGEYFISAFPLPLKGASESPVVPVLFMKEEVLVF